MRLPGLAIGSTVPRDMMLSIAILGALDNGGPWG